MAKQATENIDHFASLRVRVVGVGNLNITISTLNDEIQKTVNPLVMSSATRIEPSRILNFVSQRASIKLGTTVINETFKINKLVVFVRPVFSEYPS